MLFLIKHRNEKHIGGMQVCFHIFLISRSLSTIEKNIYICWRLCYLVLLTRLNSWNKILRALIRDVSGSNSGFPDIDVLDVVTEIFYVFLQCLSFAASSQFLTLLSFVFVFFSSFHVFSSQLQYVYVFLESIRNVYNDVNSDVMSLACKEQRMV